MNNISKTDKQQGNAGKEDRMIPLSMIADWIENELHNYVKFTRNKKGIIDEFLNYVNERSI